ncbi:MAG: hypothetical protein ACLTST_05095 [Lachnospiraceae bacterium]
MQDSGSEGIGQYFAALTNMRSGRALWAMREPYDYAVALRAVNTIDFMTAEAAEIPYAGAGQGDEPNY